MIAMHLLPVSGNTRVTAEKGLHCLCWVLPQVEHQFHQALDHPTHFLTTLQASVEPPAFPANGSLGGPGLAGSAHPMDPTAVREKKKHGKGATGNLNPGRETKHCWGLVEMGTWMGTSSHSRPVLFLRYDFLPRQTSYSTWYVRPRFVQAMHSSSGGLAFSKASVAHGRACPPFRTIT